MRGSDVKITQPAWVFNPLIRRGWQFDGRYVHNPEEPPVKPQKIPDD